MTETFLKEFDRLRSGFSSNGSTWFQPTREAALKAFSRVGFPTTSDEAWRKTNVASIAKTPFEVASLSPQPVPVWLLSELKKAFRGPILVFADGHFRPQESTLPALAGFRFAPLRTALSTDSAVLQRELGRLAPPETNAFVALNTAFFADGARVTIEANADLSVPIVLVYTALGERPNRAAFPRILVECGENSRATILEVYTGAEDTAYLTASVTEAFLGPNASLEHVKVQAEGTLGYHIASIHAHQAADSRFTSHSISLGGKLVRNDIGTLLDAPGAEASFNGLFLATGTQHVDHHTTVDHARPHGTSRETYKGILSGSAHGVFNGKVIVREDAQKTDAMQMNRNLLLSDAATLDTTPQLQILANDVKCTHGATIGQLDENALFYLRTRGIGEEEARGLLTRAFAKDLLDSVRDESVRIQTTQWVKKSLEKVLAGGSYAGF